MSSACISIPRRTPSSSPWMRRARSGHSTGPSRCCRSAPGRSPGTRTTNWRHGVTSGAPALEARPGVVLRECFPRHRAVEFRKFLDRVDASVPRNLDIQLVLDGASTLKTPLITRWLAKRPRALRLDQRLVAEHGGALLRRADHGPAPARRRSPRAGALRPHPCVSRRARSASPAVHLDQDGG